MKVEREKGKRKRGEKEGTSAHTNDPRRGLKLLIVRWFSSTVRNEFVYMSVPMGVLVEAASAE